MAYAAYDFTESLDLAGVDRAEVSHVIAAWGESPEGYGSWEGGFLLRLRDSRIAYVTGWCDTSGWGCQDGAAVYYYSSAANIDRTQLPNAYNDESHLGDQDWDDEPADLNLAVQEMQKPGL